MLSARPRLRFRSARRRGPMVAAGVLLLSSLAIGGMVDAEGTDLPPIDAYGRDAQIQRGFAHEVCVGNVGGGVAATRQLMLETFPWAQSAGGYVCKTRTGFEGRQFCDGMIDPFLRPDYYSDCWSEHASGRALDIDVRESVANGDRLVDWLLATDADGNAHAMARRLGIVQIVWNDRCWASNNPGRWWVDVDVHSVAAMRTCGDQDHHGHVHLDFSGRGADGRTSWWATPPARPWRKDPPPPPAPAAPLQRTDEVLVWDAADKGRLVVGTLQARATSWKAVANGFDVPSVLADFTGDGRADLLSFAGGELGMWKYSGSGFDWGGSWAFDVGPPLWMGAGDVDGDGRADAVWWERSTGRVVLGRSTGDGFTTRTVATLRTLHSPVLADVTGDGRADLVTWDTQDGGRLLVRASSGTSFKKFEPWAEGVVEPGAIFAGDVDGDEVADVMLWQQGDRAVVGISDGTSFVWRDDVRSMPRPVAGSSGDIDGDGLLDVLTWDPSDGGRLVLWAADGAGLGRVRVVRSDVAEPAWVGVGDLDLRGYEPPAEPARALDAGADTGPPPGVAVATEPATRVVVAL